MRTNRVIMAALGLLALGQTSIVRGQSPSSVPPPPPPPPPPPVMTTTAPAPPTVTNPLQENEGSSEGETKPVPTESLGTGIFSSLPFKVSFNLRSGYDDNVSTTKNAEGSPFTNIGVDLTYDFGSPRTQLSLQGGVGYTHYWETIQSLGAGNTDYDINVYVGFSVKHKATPRIMLNATGYISYLTEPDFSTSLGLNRRTGNYFYTADKFSFSYLWTNRFITVTSYSIDAIKYDDSAIGNFEDRVENTFGNEFRFLLEPNTTLAAEYRFQLVSYENNLNADSTTNFVLGGLDHDFSKRLTMSLRGGAEFRNYDQGGDSSSPYFEGSLNYTVGKNTTVTWSNRYAIQEPQIIGNQVDKGFRTGLRVKYEFTPKITGNLAAYYQRDDYDSLTTPAGVVPGFVEQAIDLDISFRYALTRYLGVEAGYDHTEVWSDLTAREYSRNRFWAGVNVVF